jgi:hypothetical protein
MTDRKKPGVAFWATVALVVALLGDPLSFGPACGLASSGTISYQQFEGAYRPILEMAFNGPEALRRVVESYAKLCGGGNVFWWDQSFRQMSR